VRAAVALSGFKAAIANKPFIAAVNRCATQNQAQHRVFQQSVKPMQQNKPVTAALKRCATQKSRATLSFSAAC